MGEVLARLGGKIDGILLDLGISSPQFDDAHRGFRPEQDGPLDLRFDQSTGIPAHQFLTEIDREELIRILCELGDTSDHAAARRIADAICIRRATTGLPKTTREFAQLVRDAKGVEYQHMHPAKLTFQGIRLYLNQEFGEFKRGMEGALSLLREGASLGVISWKHSECAILVDFFRKHETVRDEFPVWDWLWSNHRPEAEGIAPKEGFSMTEPLRPSQREIATNSRSRSALLHLLTKSTAVLVREVESIAYPLLSKELGGPKWTNIIYPEVPAELDFGGGGKRKATTRGADDEGGTTAEPSAKKKKKKKEAPKEDNEAVNASSCPPPSSVSDFLTAASLDSLLPWMKEMGVEEIVDISYMTEEELQEQGASLLQAQRLIEAAAASNAQQPAEKKKKKKKEKKEKK